MNTPLTPEQREELRRRHARLEATPKQVATGQPALGWCRYDHSDWPCDAAVLLDALDAGPRSEEGLRAKLREAEQAVRDHEAQPYPDVPDGGWIWSRDAAHLGGIVVGLRAALRATEETNREPCPECGHPATHGPKDGEWAVVR